MYILGLNIFHGDSSACLLKDGNLIGINSSGDPGGKFNIAVSADHVMDLLKE